MPDNQNGPPNGPPGPPTPPNPDPIPAPDPEDVKNRAEEATRKIKRAQKMTYADARAAAVLIRDIIANGHLKGNKEIRNQYKPIERAMINNPHNDELIKLFLRPVRKIKAIRGFGEHVRYMKELQAAVIPTAEEIKSQKAQKRAAELKKKKEAEAAAEAKRIRETPVSLEKLAQDLQISGSN